MYTQAMHRRKSMGDDQSDKLPEDVFRKIKERLILYFDGVGFFCRQRKKLLPKIPYITRTRVRLPCLYITRTRVRLPCLLLPSEEFNATSHRFIDMVQYKTHYVDLRGMTGGSSCVRDDAMNTKDSPEIKYVDQHKATEIYFRGSSYGWVVALVLDSPEVNLINPLTGLHKRLPPRFKFPDVEECSPGNYVVWTTPCTGDYIKPICGSIHGRDFLTTKYILSSNPSFSDEFLVVAIYGHFSKLAYTKFGDDKWNSIESEESYSDITFYKGKLYALTESKQLMVIQIGSCSKVIQITSSAHTLEPRLPLYLVSSSVGLLMVERVLISHEFEDNPGNWALKTHGFHVYKFDFRMRRWSNSLKDIGDDMLFVGSNCSMSVSSDHRPSRFEGNSIQFADNFLTLSYDSSEERGSFDMGVFDLKTGRTQALTASKCPIHALSPSPIWVTPAIDEPQTKAPVLLEDDTDRVGIIRRLR